MTRKDFNTLKKNLKKDLSGMKPVKAAVLGDTATQFFVQALKGTGADHGICYDIFESDIGQIELQISDPDSELYRFAPQFVVLVFSSHKTMNDFYKKRNEERADYAMNFAAQCEVLYRRISEASKATTVVINLPTLDDGVFGHYGSKLKSSWNFQQRQINTKLSELAADNESLFLVDADILQSRIGAKTAFDSRMKINADMDYSVEFIPELSAAVHGVISSQLGRVVKCVITDLDNTLWGGVIGDDGMERIEIGDYGAGKAFTSLQIFLKQLKDRGILLAVCSKNTEAIAKEPFEKHPDMVLRLDDFAMFVANWDLKSDNIRHICTTLNIGMDSIVFLDDNPFERAVVRQFIPEVVVPELPEDPSEYVWYLRSLNLFETSSYTEEDASRTALYIQETNRSGFRQSFQDESEFLKSLSMKAEVKPFNKFTIPRVAQLTQRSNQFNLRTIRYTEAEIDAIVADQNCFTLSCSLSDKFGDYGLISLVILRANGEELFIDTWIMSCRVLKRGVENLIMNNIAEIAGKNGFRKITGEYLPTAKNGIVAHLLEEMGFRNEGKWTLLTSGYSIRTNYISQV